MGKAEYTLPVDCSNIHLPFKNVCQDLHLTYQELADGSGVPLSNIAKFMSGTLKRPDIDNLAALAIFLNSASGQPVISLDEICGVTEQRRSDSELEKENEELKHQIKLLEAEKKHQGGTTQAAPLTICLPLCSVGLCCCLAEYYNLHFRLKL